jgi:hypothetical protein
MGNEEKKTYQSCGGSGSKKCLGKWNREEIVFDSLYSKSARHGEAATTIMVIAFRVLVVS